MMSSTRREDVRTNIDSDAIRFLDRWGGPLAVALGVLVLALSVVGSMYAG